MTVTFNTAADHSGRRDPAPAGDLQVEARAGAEADAAAVPLRVSSRRAGHRHVPPGVAAGESEYHPATS